MIQSGTYEYIRSAFAVLLLGSVISLHLLAESALAQAGIAERRMPRNERLADRSTAQVPFHTELQKLHANRVGRDVQLEWTTLSEIGNRGFEVHRASSESRGWQMVTFVPGGADGQFPRKYSALDRRVPPEDLRYMLRMVGNDGIIQYSHIITVPVSGILRSFTVNQDHVHSMTETMVLVDLVRQDNISLQLTDHKGYVLEHLASRRQLSAGKHEFSVDCSRLPGGEYSFLLSTSEGQYQRSYMHQR